MPPVSDAVRLVVQADDFGMCHAVNEGVALCFTEGIVTQATAMVPCPWFDEAAALAKDHGIPLAMHSTLTCEWDFLRWRPLTAGASLRGPDGTFWRTRPEARENIDPDEGAAELRAQCERFIDAVGAAPIAFDPHMAAVCIPAYVEVCGHYERPFIYPIGDVSMSWASMKSFSERGGDDKVGWLLHYLETREPGNHFLNTHPGLAGPELSSIHRPTSVDFEWAEKYRATDVEALRSHAVLEAIDRLGIQLCTVEDLG